MSIFKRSAIGIALILALVMVPITGLVPSATAQEKVELNLWTEWTTGGEYDAITELIEIWNAENPNIQVNHRPINNDEFFTVIRTGMASSEPPDILQYEGYQQTRDFAAAGQLIDLTDFWEEVRGEYVLQEPAAYSCAYEGRLYCIPNHFASGWQIFYNPDMLAEYGIEVPTTWEEFVAAAEAFKAEGVIPIAVGNSAGWPVEHYWMALIVQNCGMEKIYDALAVDGSASFTDECFVKSAADVQYLATNELFSPGMVSDDNNVAQTLFVSGLTPFFHSGTWFLGRIPEDIGFDVQMFSFPRYENAAYTDSIIGAVLATFGIPTGSDHPEEAKEFLRFLSTQQAGDVFAQHDVLSLHVGSVEAYGSDLIKQAWVGVQEASDSLPWIENEMPAAVGEEQIYRGTVELLTGQLTPEEFCENIQRALEEEKAAE